MDAPSEQRTVRCFLTYSGVKLPLQLSQELDTALLRHRNTYFRAEYDAQGRMCRCDKMVYGEVEMRHDYRYDTIGRFHVAAPLERQHLVGLRARPGRNGEADGFEAQPLPRTGQCAQRRGRARVEHGLPMLDGPRSAAVPGRREPVQRHVAQSHVALGTQLRRQLATDDVQAVGGIDQHRLGDRQAARRQLLARAARACVRAARRAQRHGGQLAALALAHRDDPLAHRARAQHGRKVHLAVQAGVAAVPGG